MFAALTSIRPTRPMPVALGSLPPETNRSPELSGLFVLCGVESFPGAAGLLCGQRSYGTVCANHKGALFFQDGIHARRQFTSYGHNGLAGSYLFGLALINAPIESAQFRIFADRCPSALNQLVAQTAVANASNLAPVFLVTSGMLTGYQTQEASDLAHVLDLAPITQARQRMSGRDGAYSWQADQKIDAAAQLRIVLTEISDLFLHFGGGQKMELQSIDQLVQLKAHRRITRQRLQLAQRLCRPFAIGGRKGNAFIQQQRLNPTFGGPQLPYLG